MIKWLIFYDDGSTFSNLDGEPYDAPPVGVIVLLQVNANGRWVFYSQDTSKILCWEWRAKNEWVSCDLVGAIDYLYHHRGLKAVLFGRWTSDENYEKIRLKADKVWRDLAHG